jgi:5-enolpyruvylshikimate-3-phosphate synthase
VNGYRVAAGGRVGGTLTVPGDKSISHRALMLGALARGVTRITGFLAGADCLATAGALAALGARIERPQETTVLVHGAGAGGLTAPGAPLDLGNSGTAMRLMMGLLAPQPFNSTLVGDASLMRRPMQRVAEPLAMMGAQIRTHEGRPPVEIQGTPQLRAIHYSLPVASAQVKSAMLATFGVRLNQTGRTLAMAGGQPLTATAVDVPADFSSAAFFLVAGCLAAPAGLMLTNIGVNPTRVGLLDLLRRMGADIRVHPRPRLAGAEPVADIEVRQSSLTGITVSEGEVPLAIDEFPVFFIAAACARGETLVRGALELRVKESDRLAVMAAGLGILGVEHRLLPDGLWIRGAEALAGGRIASGGDHRIAMAFAVAALRARAPIEIEDVANVATSFPGFERTASTVGLGLEPL